MALGLTCPSREHLHAYLLGKTTEALAQEIDDHLHHCSSCLQALDHLPVEDPLSKVLQVADLMKDDSDPDLLAKLQRRLRLVLQTPSGSDPTQASLQTPVSALSRAGSAPAAARSDTHELLDFLRPAEQADELGRLGPYRVLKVLGVGGMGVVLLAEDTRLERLVALKVLKPSLARTSSLGARLLKEARQAASIKHDHIVTIYEVGEDRRIVFLTMELLEGETLENHLDKQGRPSLVEVCRIGREIAEGLAAAHQHGLVHRDIKPSNIWLEGKRARVKILDFGLACEYQEETVASLQGVLVGTPAYMAPEQAQGEKVDGRADYFSLGCVLYRLTTGALPFRGKDTLSLLVAMAQADPTSPRRLNPEVPAELAQLILQLLNKAPADRPTSAQIVATLGRIEQKLTAPPARATEAVEPVSSKRGSAEDLQSDLENALWHTLTFANKEAFGDMTDLLKHYASSVNQLQKAHADTTAFFELLCQTNLEFRTEGPVNEAARDEVLRNELVPMLAHCFLAPLPSDQVYEAHITSLPLERAEAKLAQELRKKTRTLVQQFLQVCEKLVDQQILGLIEWVNPAACILHFFRKVVIQTESNSHVADGPRTVAIRGRVAKTTTAQTRVTQGLHEVRHARHEHHLYQAESTRIERATAMIPLPFAPLVHAIPSWLRSQVHLVTGMQFRGKLHEALVKQVAWKHLQELPAKEEFRTLAEPAITLGRYVFAGWGDAEIEGQCRREELEVRAEQDRKIARAAREFIVHRALFYVMIQAMAASVLTTGIVYSPSNTWVGLLVAVAGLWPVWAILRHGAQTRPIRNARTYYFHGLGAGVAGAAVFLLFAAGFVTNSLGLGCLGILALAAFFVCFRQAQLQSQR